MQLARGSRRALGEEQGEEWGRKGNVWSLGWQPSVALLWLVDPIDGPNGAATPTVSDLVAAEIDQLSSDTVEGHLHLSHTRRHLGGDAVHTQRPLDDEPGNERFRFLRPGHTARGNAAFQAPDWAAYSYRPLVATLRAASHQSCWTLLRVLGSHDVSPRMGTSHHMPAVSGTVMNS